MKTTSLELSMQLKEAGYPQEPGFRYCGGHDWFENPDDAEGRFEECKNDALLGEDEYCETAGLTCEYFVASPTADEILDQLPRHIYRRVTEYQLEITKETKYWAILYRPDSSNILINGEYLADAAAKMWLYLKKEGLLAS